MLKLYENVAWSGGVLFFSFLLNYLIVGGASLFLIKRNIRKIYLLKALTHNTTRHSQQQQSQVRVLQQLFELLALIISFFSQQTTTTTKLNEEVETKRWG